jgi:hypothetical protein
MVERRKSRKPEIELVDSPRGGKIIKPKKGQRLGGRQKGTPNRVTTILRDCIINAGSSAGDYISELGVESAGNAGGLEGYLQWLAINKPEAFASLLRAVLPLQIISKRSETKEYIIRTSDELRKELKERGIPTPRMFEPMRVLLPQSKGAPVTIEHE